MLRVIKLTSLILILVILILVLGVVLGIIVLTKNNWPVYPKPPVYPGAIIVKKYQDPPIEGRRYIELKTTASVQDVFSFYEKNLLADGWQPITSVIPDSISFYYTKGGVERPAYHLIVTAIPSDTETSVTLKQNISGPFLWPTGDW